ncbi:hypothetical protein RCH09_003495 [Actimicrobium sp. GrIS 1.19]|nr:hypothetical protein [Actimicrobium sp. GrIS 1.19]
MFTPVSPRPLIAWNLPRAYWLSQALKSSAFGEHSTFVMNIPSAGFVSASTRYVSASAATGVPLPVATHGVERTRGLPAFCFPVRECSKATTIRALVLAAGVIALRRAHADFGFPRLGFLSSVLGCFLLRQVCLVFCGYNIEVWQRHTVFSGAGEVFENACLRPRPVEQTLHGSSSSNRFALIGIIACLEGARSSPKARPASSPSFWGSLEVSPNITTTAKCEKPCSEG